MGGGERGAGCVQLRIERAARRPGARGGEQQQGRANSCSGVDAAPPSALRSTRDIQTQSGTNGFSSTFRTFIQLGISCVTRLFMGQPA